MSVWSIIGYCVLGLLGTVVLGFAIYFLVRFIRWLIALHKHSFDSVDTWLLNEFTRCNVSVFGKKGTGKDLIFSHVIALRGDVHYSNIAYDDKTIITPLTALCIGDNTFSDCVNGTVRKVMPTFREGADVYISDCGIFLPCQYDRELDNLYPSMPIFFALSRHLYNLNVHINSQAVDRPWKKLREQSDSYIQTKSTKRRGEYLYTKIIGYDCYNDALNGVNCTFEGTVKIPIAEIQYDTRYFRDVFLHRNLTPLERIFCDRSGKGVQNGHTRQVK